METDKIIDTLENYIYEKITEDEAKEIILKLMVKQYGRLKNNELINMNSTTVIREDTNNTTILQPSKLIINPSILITKNVFYYLIHQMKLIGDDYQEEMYIDYNTSIVFNYAEIIFDEKPVRLETLFLSGWYSDDEVEGLNIEVRDLQKNYKVEINIKRENDYIYLYYDTRPSDEVEKKIKRLIETLESFAVTFKYY